MSTSDHGLSSCPTNRKIPPQAEAAIGAADEESEDEFGDTWEELEDAWIRHHRAPRKSLYVPPGAAGGPLREHLDGRRATYRRNSQGEPLDPIHDQWLSGGRVRLDARRLAPGEGLWTGKTEFWKNNKAPPRGSIAPVAPAAAPSAPDELAMPPAVDSVAEPLDEDGPAVQPDWSSFDLGRSLRQLRSGNASLVARALRQLHLRWWHCPSARMTQLLKTAGVPKSTLDQIPAECDTCRVCRQWR